MDASPVSSPLARRNRRTPRHRGTGSRRARRLTFDRLDDRVLLTAGALDPGFGEGGQIAIPPGSPDYWFSFPTGYTPTLLATRPDGKFLVATSTGISGPFVLPGVTTYHKGSDFRLSRYLADGTLDVSFGDHGTVTTSFGDVLPSYGNSGLVDGDDLVRSILVQPDGKILIAGMSYYGMSPSDPMSWQSNGSSCIALARYEADGTLDTSFGNGGRVIDTGFESGAQHAALAADGGVILATGWQGLIRLNPNGSRDVNFGDLDSTDARTGSVVPLAGEGNYRRVATRADGTFVAAGSGRGADGYEDILVGVYDAEGDPIPGFGGGLVRTDFSTGAPTVDVIQAVILKPDGGILVGGYSDRYQDFGQDGWGLYESTALAMASYRPDGSLDPDFGDGGIVREEFDGGWAWIEDMALQPDGRIVAAGWSTWRYESDGQRDPTFDTGISAADSSFLAHRLLIQHDGGILIGGGSGEIVVKRLLGGPTATPTTTSLTTSPATSIAGQEVTFTAIVTAGGGPVTAGSVTFRDGGIDLGTTALDTAGIARFSTAALAAGSHAITAHYAPASGSTLVASSSLSLTQVVTAITPENLQVAVEALANPAEGLSLRPAESPQLGAIVAALGGLQAPEEPLQVTVTLADAATLPAQTVDLPATATLVIVATAAEPLVLDHWTVAGGVVEIQGNVEPVGLSITGGTVILNGIVLNPGSPALTVSSGHVTLNGVTAFGGDSPTILVTGGRLTVRGSTIYESATSDQAALRVEGGELDLGTDDDPGGNIVHVLGAGEWVRNTTADRVAAAGTAFVTDGAALSRSSLSGFVFADFNDDGEVNFGERGLEGVPITLEGSDFLGPVQRTLTTDADGAYIFLDLLPGSYRIREDQPAGHTQGRNSVGTAGGTTTLDQFDLHLAAGLDALNYNFGERPAAGGVVQAGQTAGIGFWNNRHGQTLIRALNGGESATNLGNWLAATFPNMFGAHAAANNLSGKTNTQVATFFQSRFVLKGEKLDAQVLATALAVYVTNEALCALGTPPGSTPVAARYGFVVSGLGVGTATFGIGADGEPFGVANGTIMSVMDLLLAADAQAVGGVLYSGDKVRRARANNVFGAINQAGGL